MQTVGDSNPAHIQAHIERIRIDGFTVLENAMNGETQRQIRTDLAPFLQRKKMGRNDFEGIHSERVYALLSKSIAMADIVEHPEVLAIVDAFLPKNYLLSAALAINVHPGETPQPIHFDDGAGGLGINKPRATFGISTIWAFDDFTATNGATEVVPGSHRWAQDRTATERDLQKVIMPAGSVLIFDGALLHRGGANTADHTRLAITPQYCAPGLRQIENMVLAVPPHRAALFSDRIQALLGYSIIDPGFMGYVDGQHPRKLIDPGYRGRKHRAELPPP